MRMAEAVGAYVDYKQSLGMRFVTEARTLKSFCQALGNVEMNQVEPARVDAYLAGKGSVTRFWHRKLDALRGFYRFALARGYATCSPLHTITPQETFSMCRFSSVKNIPYGFLALTSTDRQPSEARLRCFFVVGARFFPILTIRGRHPSPPENRGLVCLILGSRLVALTAGLSWSLNQ